VKFARILYVNRGSKPLDELGVRALFLGE